MVLAFLLSANQSEKNIQTIFYFLAIALFAPVAISLMASFYVYDLSDLYKLSWASKTGNEKLIVNINAGFDETSELLKSKFNNAELVALDFYDPIKHTEISIKRARKAYPPYPNTQHITTNNLELADNIADKIFVILSAHEIRNADERILFFKELKRIVKPEGEIIVTEHLRDIPNFLAYNIGFFHFYSKNNWLKTFEKSGFQINQEKKITPFISTFILGKNGNSL